LFDYGSWDTVILNLIQYCYNDFRLYDLSQVLFFSLAKLLISIFHNDIFFLFRAMLFVFATPMEYFGLFEKLLKYSI